MNPAVFTADSGFLGFLLVNETAANEETAVNEKTAVIMYHTVNRNTLEPA
jgi:hypothetical protein